MHAPTPQGYLTRACVPISADSSTHPTGLAHDHAGNCTSYHCYKGGPAEPPEGLATGGCPLASHPAQLVDNADCVLCMDCLKVASSTIPPPFPLLQMPIMNDITALEI